MLKKFLLGAVIATSFAAVPVASIAQRQVIITMAPPAPMQEVVPAPRRGKEWVPGHYEWRGNRHQWVRGYWVNARPGYAYNAPRWVERDGRWFMEQGRWVRGGRDRDGDGVRNRNDRDRDGDGVRNRNDRQPNNPNRN